MEKILVIKHGALGDFIHQLGIMKAIRREHKTAAITLITAPAQQKFAAATGYFDNIVIDSRNYNPFEWYRIIKQTIVDGKWDYIYNLQGSKRVVKKYFPLARLASNHGLIIRYPAPDGAKDNMKEVIFKKKYPLTLGTKQKRAYTLKMEKIDLSFCKLSQEVEEILPKTRFALLIPGCSPEHGHKRWKPENYARLAGMLEKEGVASVIIGTNAEKENIEKILSLAPHAISLMGKTSLTDLPPLGERALVTIGNDTGPLHLIASSGSKTVAVFSPITASSQDKSPNVTNFVGQNDINDITVEQVFAAAVA